MKNPTRSIVIALALSAGMFLSPTASAETIEFKATLKGSAEVPPNNSPATGSAEAFLDTEIKKLTWKVSYSGLSGAAIGAHIHGPSDSGGNAGILLPFFFVANPINQSKDLTDGQISALMKGLWYINIHTAQHPGGEIRGQLIRQ